MQTAPVLLVVHDRPDLAVRAATALARAGQRPVLVAGDGDPERPEVARTRDVVVRVLDQLDDLRVRFRDEQVGRDRAVVEAVDWLFDVADRGIVLMEDHVADPTFFGFCDVLLERYADDARVMSVNGSTVHAGPVQPDGEDYHFTRYPRAGGFATWRRAWSRRRSATASWPRFKALSGARAYVDDDAGLAYWTHLFDAAATGATTDWEPTWTLAHWLDNGLAVAPRANLVEDVGFDDRGTTRFDPALRLHGPTGAVALPPGHPPSVHRHALADAAEEQLEFRPGWLVGLAGRG